MGRGAAKPLVELLQSFVRSLVQSFCRALVELGAELLQSFGRARCFEVRHVDSATTYRAQHFLNQSKAGLAKFENLNTQPLESIDHSYLGSMIEKVAGRRYARDDARYFAYCVSLSFSLNMLIDKYSFLFVFFRLPG